MFWSLGHFTSPSIDTILERESFTLEDLLEEDELLQECKGQNAKLSDLCARTRRLRLRLRPRRRPVRPRG